MGKGIIFIVSQPRSGSTLLQHLLLNSLDIDGSNEESWFLLPYLSSIDPDITNSIYGTDLARAAIEKLISEDQLKEEISNFIESVYNRTRKSTSTYLLDKTPRYYEILPSILDVLPQSKIVILIRDPLDVLASIYQRWKPKNPLEMNRFGRDLLIAPFRLQYFLTTNKNNQNIICLKYEDLVSNTPKSIKKICKWLNIEFTRSMLEYRATKVELGDNKFTDHQASHTDSIGGKKKIDAHWWLRRFAKGYINYLSTNGYHLYDLESGDGSANSIFDLFKNYHEFQSYHDRDLSINNICKQLAFYLKAKFLHFRSIRVK